jgi:hypothetical protein
VDLGPAILRDPQLRRSVGRLDVPVPVGLVQQLLHGRRCLLGLDVARECLSVVIPHDLQSPPGAQVHPTQLRASIDRTITAAPTRSDRADQPVVVKHIGPHTFKRWQQRLHHVTILTVALVPRSGSPSLHSDGRTRTRARASLGLLVAPF